MTTTLETTTSNETVEMLERTQALAVTLDKRGAEKLVPFKTFVELAKFNMEDKAVKQRANKTYDAARRDFYIRNGVNAAVFAEDDRFVTTKHVVRRNKDGKVIGDVTTRGVAMKPRHKETAASKDAQIAELREQLAKASQLADAHNAIEA